MQEKWELVKMMSKEVANVLDLCGYETRGARMSQCADVLTTQTCSCGCELVWRTNYCRDRLCPVCEWRKSIVMARRATAAINRAMSNTREIVMLTLTVRNVEWSELRDTLREMHRNWGGLWRMYSEKWGMTGYIRRTEVTVGRDGRAHPHMHILIDRRSEGGYVRQKALCAGWKNTMGLSYDPVVDIRLCPRDEQQNLVRYVHKYCVKASPAIILGMPAADVIEYIEAVKGVRMTSSGGTLKMKTPEDVTEDEMMAGVDDVVLQRTWCDHTNDYIVKCPRCGQKMQLETSKWDNEAKAYVIEWPVKGGADHGSVSKDGVAGIRGPSQYGNDSCSQE